jgi:hypothetical protein
MCAIRGSLTIITSIPNEARFSLESKKSDLVQGVASCAYFCFFNYVVGSGSTASALDTPISSPQGVAVEMKTQ